MGKKTLDFDKSISRSDREPRENDPLRDPRKNPMRGRVSPREDLNKLPQKQKYKKKHQ